MYFKKTAIAIGVLIVAFSGYFTRDVVGDVRLGATIHALTGITLPLVVTDNIVVERGSVSFKTAATSVMQGSSNLFEVTNKTTSRTNIGLGPQVSIMDFATADPSGATSSDAAFVSCLTASKNCYIPPGTYVISCTNHNAVLPSSTTPITVYSDSWQRSTLKVAGSCTLPTAGIITLANVQNLTIDVNNATASASAPIISSFNGTSGIQIPTYKDIHLINVGAVGGVNNANIIGIRVGSTSAQNVVNMVVTHNTYSQPAGAASSTTANQCILVSQTAGTVTGGVIDSNFCAGSGIDVSASLLKIINNEIASWAYRSGIYTEQSTLSSYYNISHNQIHDGAVTVVNGVPTDGVINWGYHSVISDNQCTNIGGACVTNGGQNSSITDNNAYGVGKRNDQVGGAAYFSLFQDTAFNGNNSIWSGNYAADDGSGKLTDGFADNTGNSGLSLVNNYFSLVTTPYFLSD